MSFCGLALEQPVDRDARPPGHDDGDVVLVDLLLHHRMLRPASLRELALELGHLAVADLGDALKVAVTLGALGLHSQLVELTGRVLDPLERLLLLRPARGERRRAPPSPRRAPSTRGSRVAGSSFAIAASSISSCITRRFASSSWIGEESIWIRRLRSRLVDQVDRLVGQEAVGDVAVREHRRGDERRVADPDAVMRLVALLQAAQDRDGVLHGRLVDEDGREAALEGGVLLDVLAVLVERRGADAAKLAAGEHRLQEVRGVDRALGRAGPDDRVQLVDEQDDPPLARLDLGEHRLQALLELTAVLGAGEQRADVERPDLAVLEPLGDVARDDALRQPLGDRRLADAGLADQHRVVLRAPREDLDHAADLLVAPDHGVELARLGLLGQVASVLLERLVAPLRILRRDPLPAAHLLDPGEDLLARYRLERQEEVLGRDVVVLEPGLLILGAVQYLRERVRDPGLHVRGTGRGRPPGELLLRVGAQALPVGEQLLVEQRQQQVLGVDLGVPAAPRRAPAPRRRPPGP